MENDLIHRNALVEVLEKIRTALDQRDEGLAAKIMQIHIQFIECIPAVEAVEVVLCKDCKHSCEDDFDGSLWCCRDVEREVVDNHFCSYGERRADE